MTRTEAETRKEMIYTRLMEAGWDVNDLSKVAQEYDLVVSAESVKEPDDPYAGHQFCDYVLLGKEGNRKNKCLIKLK